MTDRIYNFGPGPATLPLSVLQQIQNEFLDYNHRGMSILEISHRSADFEKISESAAALFRKLLSLPDDYQILFLGGGASTQFATVPMNYLTPGQQADYVDTGEWSARAIEEAGRIGKVRVLASSKNESYNHIPSIDTAALSDNTSYLHITSNNTIYGTQYHQFPKCGSVPLVCDMSSDIASRKIDYSVFDLLYAGAQKNLGPAGVTIVAIRQSMLDRATKDIPAIFSHHVHAEKKSLYHTPPVFAVYAVKLILEWIEGQGGLEAIEKKNVAKKERIYQMMDLYPDFYRGTAQSASRSWMNITMRLPSEELEAKFILQAAQAGMVGLKGHRSVGGIRVSLYNAMPLQGAQNLSAFMEHFRSKN